MDRLLFAFPDAEPPQTWTTAEVSAEAIEQVQGLFDCLFGLELTEDGPVEVQFSDEAEALWIRWYNTHQAEIKTQPDPLRGAWSKMPSHCARLILITHLTRWAAGEVSDPKTIDQVSVANGTILTEYFKSHARRLHGILRESDEDRLLRKVIEWIRSKNNTGFTTRDIYSNKVARIKNASEAKKVLNELVHRGLGRWAEPKLQLSGQKSTEQFFLN